MNLLLENREQKKRTRLRSKATTDEYSNEEWVWLKHDFEKNYDLEKKLDPFGFLMQTIFKQCGITSGNAFMETTGLSREYYSKLKGGNYKPELRIVVTICIALKLNFITIVTLLEALGIAFKRGNRVHFAYAYLIENHRELPLEECNNILLKLGLKSKDLLGSHERLS